MVKTQIISFLPWMVVSSIGVCFASQNDATSLNQLLIKQLQQSGQVQTTTVALNQQFMQLAYTNTFVFNPRKLRWKAYDHRGRVIRSGRASGGSNYCRDVGRACRTVTGHFRIKSIGSAKCKSSRYPKPRGGAPMPYCSFFHGNYAIHGSNHLPRYNASHGCIRVHPRAARWLSRNFFKVGKTKVVVLPY